MTQSATIPNIEKGPSLEEEAAAQEKAAGATTEVPLAGEEETSERPEWLPEKFDSPEAMAKAYAELEKKQGAGEASNGADTEAAEAAEQAVEQAGLDMDALTAEFAADGALSEASLEKLAKVGISQEMVDQYIAGQQAQADIIRAELLGPVGSDEAYSELITWASENLDDGAIDAYNEALESGSTSTIKMAVENLHGKFIAANGQEPSRELNGKGVDTQGSRYESTADLMKDMQNPEYRTNPTFRKKVEEKLARSSIM